MYNTCSKHIPYRIINLEVTWVISYKPFWVTIKRKKVSTYALREKHSISPNTLTRMRKNQYLSMRTIEDFCRILDCDISDIAEYTKD